MPDRRPAGPGKEKTGGKIPVPDNGMAGGMDRRRREKKMGKGNNTAGNDRRKNKNIDSLIRANANKKEYTEHYKEIARQREKVIKHGQPYALALKEKLESYIEEKNRERKPLTIAGLIKASEVNHDTYYRYRNGEADHLLYAFMDLHGIDYSEEGNIYQLETGEMVLLVRLSEIIKSAELSVQEQLEENCYTNRGNPAGSIFGLKARYDWIDQPPDTRTTNNNTLVLNNVASLEEAKDALKRLEG